jgi:hypothetical protein
MEEDGNVVYKLSCLASIIKKEIIQVLHSFIKTCPKTMIKTNNWKMHDERT